MAVIGGVITVSAIVGVGAVTILSGLNCGPGSVLKVLMKGLQTCQGLTSSAGLVTPEVKNTNLHQSNFGSNPYCGEHAVLV